MASKSSATILKLAELDFGVDVALDMDVIVYGLASRDFPIKLASRVHLS